MTPAAEHVLRQYSSSRLLTVDEHMFAVDVGAMHPGTFRLQVFAAPGAHPVAVATQTDREGPSLVNAAETYAAEVWRRLFPQETEPPIWIQHQLLPDNRSDRFTIVTFARPGDYALSSPQWHPISDAELARLVGHAVDRSRGEGYVPRPPEPEDEPRYRTISTIRLPRPDPFREAACMPAGITLVRRLAYQFVPRHAARECCWYHGGDWHLVCAAAVRLVRRARRQGVPVDDIADVIHAQAKAEGLRGWDLDALDSLVSPVDGIQLAVFAGGWGTSYINGQHRGQALLEAGVRRTVIIDWVTTGTTQATI